MPIQQSGSRTRPTDRKSLRGTRPKLHRAVGLFPIHQHLHRCDTLGFGAYKWNSLPGQCHDACQLQTVEKPMYPPTFSTRSTLQPGRIESRVSRPTCGHIAKSGFIFDFYLFIFQWKISCFHLLSWEPSFSCHCHCFCLVYAGELYVSTISYYYTCPRKCIGSYRAVTWSCILFLHFYE